MATIYATIKIELRKAGLYAICEDIEDDCFCTDGDLSPLEELINKAEMLCNPETRFTLADGKEEDDG